MKYTLILLVALLSNDPRGIAKINALKKEAEKAFLSGNYERSVEIYTMLYDSLGVDEDEVKLNLAHAQYQLSDIEGAKASYRRLDASSNARFKSIAYQQLGVISKEAGQLEQSLQQFKSSIKADPLNQEARYNYEVVKKLLEEQEGQQDQPSQDNQDQQQQDNQDQQQGQQEQGEQESQEEQNQQGEQQNEEEQQGDEQKKEPQQKGEGQDQEKSEEEMTQEEMTREKLKEMNISEDKARMILEAMKNNEIQYLQQQKRKASERPPSNKPDW